MNGKIHKHVTDGREKITAKWKNIYFKEKSALPESAAFVSISKIIQNTYWLTSAGTELIFFLITGTVLCFRVKMRTTLITVMVCSSLAPDLHLWSGHYAQALFRASNTLLLREIMTTNLSQNGDAERTDNKHPKTNLACTKYYDLIYHFIHNWWATQEPLELFFTAVGCMTRCPHEGHFSTLCLCRDSSGLDIKMPSWYKSLVSNQ